MAGLLEQRRGAVSSVFDEDDKKQAEQNPHVKEKTPPKKAGKKSPDSTQEPASEERETEGFTPKIRSKGRTTKPRKPKETMRAAQEKPDKQKPKPEKDSDEESEGLRAKLNKRSKKKVKMPDRSKDDSDRGIQPDMERKVFAKEESSRKAAKLNLVDEDDDDEMGRPHGAGRRRFASIALSLCCVYLVYLIYGVVMTNFVFDDTGNVVPEVMTLQEVTEQHEYEVVASYYYRTRSIYEQCLTLDYRIAKGVEDPLVIAPEYEAMLDQIGKLSIDLQALTVDTSYNQIQQMMLSWVGTDIAVYCQNMGTAISQNNAEAAEQAILGREVCYNDFAMLTANMVSVGNQIKGVDIKDIRDWSTDKYIAEVLEGEKYDG